MGLWMGEEDQKRRSRCSQKKQGWFKITGFTTGFLYQNFWFPSQREKRTIKKKYNTWSELEKELYISLNQYLVHVDKVYADLEDKAVTS